MAGSKGLWFLLGVSTGALVGVLYAPQSGLEMRNQLGRKAQEGRDLVTRKASDLREQAGQMKDQAAELKERAVQFANRSKQAVRDVVSPQQPGSSAVG